MDTSRNTSLVGPSQFFQNGNELFEDGEQEDEEVCRICRTNGDDENPLFYPCACNGSIRYVHQSCLTEWLKHSNKKNCEVCKHEFSFSPIYADGAPARLSSREFFLGLAQRLVKEAYSVFRASLAFCVWVVVVPYTTCWLFRLTFVHSLTEAQTLFSARLTPVLVLVDCVYGFVMSSYMVVVYAALVAMRERRERARVRGGEGGERREGQVAAAGHGRAPPEAREGEVGREWVPPEERAIRLLDDAGLDVNEVLENGAFADLVGFTGPILTMLENALYVQAFNGIFLALCVLLPFTLGRLSLSLLHCLGALLASLLSPLTSFLSSASPLPLPLPLPVTMPPWLSGPSLIPPPGSFFRDLATVAVGYYSAFFCAVLALASWLTLSYCRFLLRGAHHEEALHMAERQNPLAAFILLGVPLPNRGGQVAAQGGLQVAGHARPQVRPQVVATERQLAQAQAQAQAQVVDPVGTQEEAQVEAQGEVQERAPVGGGGAQGQGRLAQLMEVGVGLRHLRRDLWARERFRRLREALQVALKALKVALLLFLEMGFFPLFIGTWLDLCAGPIRAQPSPLLPLWGRLSVGWVGAHWAVGLAFMVGITGLVGLLREVLRPGTLFFLRDPNDPNFNPLRDLQEEPILPFHTRRLVLSASVYLSLAGLTVFLPLSLAGALFPSLLPLRGGLGLPFSSPQPLDHLLAAVPLDLVLLALLGPLSLRALRPREAVRRALSLCLSSLCSLLALSDRLMPPPQPHPHPQPQVHSSHSPTSPEPSSAQRHSLLSRSALQALAQRVPFGVRVALLVLFTWAAMALCLSLGFSLPLLTGRAIHSSLSSLPLIGFSSPEPCSDMYTFFLGGYVVALAWVSAQKLAVAFQTHSAQVVLQKALRWAVIAVQSCSLLSLWFGVVPLLAGLLFELTIILPMRMPVEESPVFLLYEDWALGMILLKFWTRMILSGRGDFLSGQGWREKLQRVIDNGFSQLEAMWVFTEVVWPVLSLLLWCLCFPYLMVKGVVPLLGFSTLTCSTAFRYGWIVSLAAMATLHDLKKYKDLIQHLHDTIRDERYLVGRRLHNFSNRIIS